MRSNSSRRPLALFFVAGILSMTIGSLLWPTPMGKLSVIVGLGMVGIAVLGLIVGPHRRIDYPLWNHEMTRIQAETDSNTVPFASVLGRVGLVCAWMLEVLVLLAKFCSGGAWPSSGKCWAITGITAVATIYELTLWKSHRIYAQTSVALNNLQSWAVIGVIACYLAIGAWLLMPLPL